MGPGRSNGRWWVLGVIAVLLAGVVGGPFVYIHFIEGKAPAPLSLKNAGSASPTASGISPAATVSPAGGAAPAAGPGATSIDGTWKVAGGSQAGCRVKEVLFGQSNTAVGRTTSITGSLTVAGGNVTAGNLSADLTTVSSDQSRRDNQFQHRIMDTSSYPTAQFVLTQPIQLGPAPADGATVTRQVTGNLKLHGTTRSVTFPVSVMKTGSTIDATGSVPIVFADYNIPNPSFGSVVTTDNHGTLEFLLNFTKS